MPAPTTRAEPIFFAIFLPFFPYLFGYQVPGFTFRVSSDSISKSFPETWNPEPGT
jgi:hypothetical protein